MGAVLCEEEPQQGKPDRLVAGSKAQQLPAEAPGCARRHAADGTVVVRGGTPVRQERDGWSDVTCAYRHSEVLVMSPNLGLVTTQPIYSSC